jgi:hypothetical protein
VRWGEDKMLVILIQAEQAVVVEIMAVAVAVVMVEVVAREDVQ